MSNSAWLVVALVVVFVAVGGYALAIVLREGKLERRIRELSEHGH